MNAPAYRLLACDGLLYRGTNLEKPEEVWDYPRKCWVPYWLAPLSGDDLGWISDEAGEKLKTDNAAAEHFGYYDVPPWLQLPASLRPYHAPPGKVAFKIFVKDDVRFRMPASRDVPFVDEIWRHSRWTRYEGDRVAPAMFGEFLGIEEVDAEGDPPKAR